MVAQNIVIQYLYYIFMSLITHISMSLANVIKAGSTRDAINCSDTNPTINCIYVIQQIKLIEN